MNTHTVEHPALQTKAAKYLLPLLVVFFASVSMAQAPSEAEQLREELRELKKAYQERIEQIDARLRRLDAKVGSQPQTQAEMPALPVAPAAASEPAPATAVAARQFANEQFARDTESRERATLMESQPMRERVEQVLQDRKSVV